MNIESEEFDDFLGKYPSPAIRACSTIKIGYISLIKPIKTICGPEIICNYADAQKVRDRIKGIKAELKG